MDSDKNKKENKEKKKEEAEEMRGIEYRMYENKFPNIDDLVMVNYLIYNKIFSV